MLRCSDGSLYTGVTTDTKRRFEEHKAGKVGAKYTRGRIPLHMAYEEHCSSRSEAQSREYVLRHLPKKEKESLVKILKSKSRNKR